MLRRSAQILHIAVEMVVGIAFIAAVALGVLAWRLSQGPLDLAWLARRLEVVAQADNASTRLVIDHAALAWEGWRRGVDAPLDIRLDGVRAVAPDGAVIAAIPRAEVSLSPGWLLIGRVVPRGVEVDGARLRVLRAEDGGLQLDLGTLGEAAEPEAPAVAPAAQANPFDALLEDIGRPPGNDRTPGNAVDSRLSQLRRVLIRDADLTVQDRQLGAVWRAPRAEIDLRRSAAGLLSGSADMLLALGNEQVRLTGTAAVQPGDAGSRVDLDLGQIRPAALARAAPKLAALANLDAPLKLSGTLVLGPHFAMRHWALHATLAAGHAHIGTSDVPLRQGQIDLAGDAANAQATLALTLPGAQHDPLLRAQGALRLADGQFALHVAADLDRVAFTDLPALWPTGIDHGARSWAVENLTAGTAHDGHVVLDLTAPEDLSDVTLTGLSGQMQGDDVSVSWLSSMPQIEHGHATLGFDGPNVLTVIADGGQLGALRLRTGTVRIVGLLAHDQMATIQTHVDGPVADVWTLLRNKRLHLLDRHPVDLHDPSGGSSTDLTVKLPLQAHLSIDDVAITAHAALTDLHLGGLVARRDLDHGNATLVVTNDGLDVQGRAEIGGIPADLTAKMDFRAGPPTEVVQQASARGQASDRQLAAAGIDLDGYLSGSTDLAVAWRQRRDGQADIGVHADLAQARIAGSPVGWSKPRGGQAALDAHLLLDHDQLVGVDRLTAEGDGISVQAHADMVGGRPSLLRIDHAMFGRSVFSGQIRFATAAGAPLHASLSGPLIDVSPRLTRDPNAPPPPPGAATSPPPPGAATSPPAPATPPPDSVGPPWVLDAHFDAALMAKGRRVDGVSVHAENDGRVVRVARLQLGGTRLAIEPVAGGRSLTGSADDAGALLRAFNIADDMQGGHMTLAARFDDTQPGHPLSGTAQISNFRMSKAPALARLLQAMTLYGVVELLQGPGLGFSQLVAPFRLSGDVLDLTDARAFSSSLGITAKGRFDLARRTADAEGTIVPAYFFNSLLGGLPIVGKLFSPERGGGVFAATYHLRGNLDDPQVSVNPLAALTPGFLRGLFGGL